MIAFRSTIFNIVFYIHMIAVFVVVTPVYFFLPQRLCMAVVSGWARRTRRRSTSPADRSSPV